LIFCATEDHRASKTICLHDVYRFSGGQLVDASPDITRELKQELGKLAGRYGGGEGVDMTKFPDFKFEEPKLDPINSSE
jgi:Mitochondrial ATP synthase coupling factor 6